MKISYDLKELPLCSGERCSLLSQDEIGRYTCDLDDNHVNVDECSEPETCYKLEQREIKVARLK
jgi:hypothetical protein